jgi:outer membrane protein OmpA-like peptidoglycan-associated protein
MKHIFNNLSEEEKSRILEQHTGGKEFNIENFNKLVENKLGNVKPLVNEQGNLGGTGQRGGGSGKGTGYEKEIMTYDTTNPITLSKDSFKTGSDQIDASSSEYQTLKQKLSNLPKSDTKLDVKVVGGASSVGTKQGYRNDKLAERRADNLVAQLKKDIPGIDGKVNFITSGYVQPNTDIPESDEALAAQRIDVSFSQKGKGQVKTPIEVDNTAVNVNKFTPNNGGGTIPPIGGKQKRVCVKIPEAFVEDYKKMLREFKNKHMLKSLPFGVYDV